MNPRVKILRLIAIPVIVVILVPEDHLWGTMNHYGGGKKFYKNVCAHKPRRIHYVEIMWNWHIASCASQAVVQ